MENFKQIPTLGFSEACKLASSRITDFKGRSRRSELWWWMLVVMVANMVIGMFFTANLLLSAIVAIIVMFFGLAVTVRRVQDTGKSAMWVYARPMRSKPYAAAGTRRNICDRVSIRSGKRSR